MLSCSNFRFTETRLLTETWQKCLLCILQYRSKVSWQSRLETQIPILDDIETWFSRYCQITFDLHCKCLWERQNQRKQRAMHFKSSLFISLIKCPIVSFFNYKLLTRLSFLFFAIVRAAAAAEWSANLTKKSGTAESTFSKQTSPAHAEILEKGNLWLPLEFNARGYYVNLLPKVLCFHRGSEVDSVWLVNELHLKFRSFLYGFHHDRWLFRTCLWISSFFLLFFELVVLNGFLSLFRQLLILYLTFPFCNIQLRSFLELTC